MEAAFARDLRLLTNALRYPTFRFIVIGHNRKSIITDVTAHIQATYPNRPYHELRLSGKTYREIIDGLKGFQTGFVVIPDFDWLFQPGNESVCIGFNQRRDALAKLPIALLCFVEPSGYRNLPKRLPDWWSLRSLDLEFRREMTDETPRLVSLEREISSLGGQTKEEKEAEIGRLLKQLEGVEPGNKVLLSSLSNQIASLYYDLSDYDKAKNYWGESLMLDREIGYKQGEGVIINNLAAIARDKDDYATALTYLQQSLAIAQQIGNKQGAATTLHNMGVIYFEHIKNITQALPLLQQAYLIREQLSSSDTDDTLQYLDLIRQKIGEDRYNQLLQSLPETPEF